MTLKASNAPSHNMWPNAGFYDRFVRQHASFRNPNGEYKRWLQVFCVKPTTHSQTRKPQLEIMKIAPWVFDTDKIDREFLLSLWRLGGMKHLPPHWSNDNWEWLSGGADKTTFYNPYDVAREASPIYAMLVPGVSGTNLIEHLARFNALDPMTKAFWSRMERFILLSQLDGGIVPHAVRDVKTEFSDPIESIVKELKHESD